MFICAIETSLGTKAATEEVGMQPGDVPAPITVNARNRRKPGGVIRGPLYAHPGRRVANNGTGVRVHRIRRAASLSLEVQTLALVLICILVLTISLHVQLARIRLHPERIESLA